MAFALDLFLNLNNPINANIVPHVAITIWKKKVTKKLVTFYK